MVLELRSKAVIEEKPYTFDIATQTPVAFIRKSEIEARQKLFAKSPKEHAELSTKKSQHKQMCKSLPKRQLNPANVQNKFMMHLAEHYNMEKLTDSFNFKVGNIKLV